MFEGKSLTFIRAEHNKGTSKKGNEYEISQVTLSDGLESFKVDVDARQQGYLATLNKGDKIDVKVDVVERFGRHQFQITEVQKSKTAVA